MRRIDLPADELHRSYYDRFQSSNMIAKQFGVDPSTVLSCMERYGMKRRKRGDYPPPNRIDLPREKLNDLYSNKKLSAPKIAKMVSVCPRVVYRNLREYGVKTIVGGRKGRKHSKEAIEKIRLASIGRKHSKGTIRKISEAKKGKNNPMKRADVKRKVRDKLRRGKFIFCESCGKRHYKQKSQIGIHRHMFCSKKCFYLWLKVARKGKLNPFYGKTPTANGYYISGKRKDLGQYFRSSWEANIARYFNFIGIKWNYEPKRFYYDDFSYLPDFYLPSFQAWIEVKAIVSKEAEKKIQQFRKENVLIILGKREYKIIEKTYSHLIDNWEDDVKCEN